MSDKILCDTSPSYATYKLIYLNQKKSPCNKQEDFNLFHLDTRLQQRLREETNSLYHLIYNSSTKATIHDT